jgi:hypothetical protein
MNKKIIGIFVAVLFITTVFPVMTSASMDKMKINNVTFVAESTSYHDDVPVWEIGDTWKYKVDGIDIEYEGANLAVDMHLEMGELILKVTDDTGGSYKLEFNAIVDGEFTIYIDSLQIEFSGGLAKLRSSKIEGDFNIRKSDLGIEEINFQVISVFKVKITENPFTPLIRFLTLRVPIGITLNINFDNPYTILDFPLEIDKTWGLPCTNISIDGEVESVWLNIINFMNRIAKLFGYGFIPAEFEELLPVINVSKALELLGYQDTFFVNEISPIFNCHSMEEITLPYGTVNAYNVNISVIDVVNIYYAPEVGNIVKISVDGSVLSDFVPINISDINLELLETNYT